MDLDKEEEAKIRAQKQAEEVGCWGLVDGIAKNLKTHKKFSALTSTKEDGPFYCGECYSDAVIRKCTEKKDHFAHQAPLTPVIPKKESELHYSCKEEICSALEKVFPNGKWATERTIPANKENEIPDLRPDISGWIGNARVVIEIQSSALSVKKIVQRTTDYRRRRIAILWVIPLLHEMEQPLFRPRLYERYFHSIYYGRVFYWWKGRGMLLKPVHFMSASRHIPYAVWYDDEIGEEASGGGYTKIYKTIKQPCFGEDLNIGKDFFRHEREEFKPENERKLVPPSIIWKDRLKAWWPKEKRKIIVTESPDESDNLEDFLAEEWNERQFV